MSKYSAIKNATNAYIRTNGRQEITGNILNAVMVATIESLGRFYQFVGVAFPDADPGDPDENVAYIAGTPGTYERYGGLTVENGEFAVFKYNGGWVKQVAYIVPTKVSELINDNGYITNIVADLVNYYTKTEVFNKSEVAAILANYYDKQFVDILVHSITEQSYVVSWDGAAEPVVSQIPSGVTVIWNGTPYNGTMTASSSTIGNIYLVYNGVNYDMYVTSNNSGFLWYFIGTTTLDLSAYATKKELNEVDALSQRGLRKTSTPTIVTVSGLQLNGTSKYKSASSSLKVRYIPVTNGDIIHLVATNATAANLRHAFSTNIPADQVNVTMETLVNDTRIDKFIESHIDGYFGIYSTGFSDAVFSICEDSELGEKVGFDTSNVKLMLNALGITGCVEDDYIVWYSGFVYYDDGTTASSSTLKYSRLIPTQGKKYLFYPQNVSTGTGRAGLAFYDSNGDYISGIREIISADASGYRVSAVEIPVNAYSFRTTLNDDSISAWFCFLTDNPRILDYEEKEDPAPDTTPDDCRYLMRMLGVTDYSEITSISWNNNKFIYYDNGTDGGSTGLSYTSKCYTDGKKYLLFTQNVSTGTGRAGLAFYDSNDTYISGVRQFVGADAIGYRVLAVEIPSGAYYFRATINNGNKLNFFAYVTDDENVLKYAGIGETDKSSLHLKVCLLGNSYTADAWRYVPAMLLAYGITCEVNFYYRGSGSLADLDDQWTHTSQYDPSNYDGSMHIRLHFTVDSRIGVSWGSATRASAQSIVAADKYDIISIQQAGKQCKTPSYWIPYLQNVIDKIMDECDYPFTLCLFEAYTSADDLQHEASLLNQKDFFKKYPFTMLMPAAAAVFSAQENPTLSALGDSPYHNMYANDNTHMQEGLPCYLTALVVVQSILDKYMPGKSVLNDQFRATAENIAHLGMDSTANGESTGVTEENCYLAQKTAICAVKNPFEIIEP